MRLYLLIACATLLSVYSTAETKPTAQPQPISFGVIADIQWADKDTRGARHYREAIDQLEKCVADLNTRDLAFTIQLGDIIDGNTTAEQTHSELDRVLDVFGDLSMPTYHVVGNHCLTADKKVLGEKLKLDRFYYDFTVPEAKGWRFIVLDGNDAGYGVLGKIQLEWFRKRLALADENEEQVIVFNHFALLQGAAAHHRMTKPEPLIKLINASDCVVAYFAGHDHAGGYTLEKGIHHITVKGMVEAPKKNAYAIIEISPGQLKETGFGKEPSRNLKINLPERALPDGSSARDAWTTLVGPQFSKRPEFAFVQNNPDLANVLVYGDSISIGYTQQVRQHLADKANVYRIYCNGGDSASFIPKMVKMHETMEDYWSFQWDVIHFNVGLHDLKYVVKKSKLDKKNGKQVTTLEAYEKNLRSIVAYLKEKAPGATLVFATTTPVPEGEPGRVAGDAAKYNAVALKVMKAFPEIEVNDLFTFTQPHHSAWWTSPGNVHYNRAGRLAQGEEVARVIRKELGQKTTTDKK